MSKYSIFVETDAILRPFVRLMCHEELRAYAYFELPVEYYGRDEDIGPTERRFNMLARLMRNVRKQQGQT